MSDKSLRKQLADLLDWGHAHVDWTAALKDVPTRARGTRPKGASHSAWELLEHARLAQLDILEFSRNPKHVSPDWPSGYWPKTSAPPSAAAWQKSIRDFEAGRKAMQKLILDPKSNLESPIPGGSGQTILREVLLLADHNSYHLGQLVQVLQILGAWKPS